MLAGLHLPVPKTRPKLHLWSRNPVQCDSPIDRPTLVVSYPVRDAPKPDPKGKQKPSLRAATRCVQADSPRELLPALAATIADAGAPGPMKIDILTATQDGVVKEVLAAKGESLSVDQPIIAFA